MMHIFTESVILWSVSSARSSITVASSPDLRSWIAAIWASSISLALSFGYAENVNTA